MASEDLKEYVLSQPTPGEFTVRPYCSTVGDFISFCWAPQEGQFFTRRVDEYLTTYHSIGTKKVIGCKIKGINYLVEQCRKMIADGKKSLTIKSISIVARGLSAAPAQRSDYEEVWQNGDDIEIEDPSLQPA